jgi:nitroreductase
MNTKAIDFILTRRSIRKYTSEQVSEETIELLLKAGSYAPSANNFQPWHFLTVTEREILNKLSTVHPYAGMLKQAPLAILVCGDNNLQPILGYQAVDCSAATQNILLAAHAIGLGGVWLGVFPREQRMKDIKEFFQLPENINPITLISIGYPDEKITQTDRFNKEKIHLNKW